MNKNPEYVELNGKQYKINTDFRVAIECFRIIEDETIGDLERALGIICELFGKEAIDNTDDYEKLLKIAKKYLMCGQEETPTNQKKDMDYTKDYDYIWTSFYSDYNGLDLDKQEMHWWKFYKLLNGLSNSELGNCCILNRVRNIRNFDLKDIKDPVLKDKIIEAKKLVSLDKKEVKLTDEQQKSVDEFYQSLGY